MQDLQVTSTTSSFGIWWLCIDWLLEIRELIVEGNAQEKGECSREWMICMRMGNEDRAGGSRKESKKRRYSIFPVW